MIFLHRFSYPCLLLILLTACAPSRKPMSKEDRQIVAVMMVIGAGIGAGVGAASTTVSGDTAGVAVAGGLAGAFAGYALGDMMVNHMNQQEKDIRLSEGSKHGDIYVRRMRPDTLKISLERGAEFPSGSAKLSRKGKQHLDDIARAVRSHGRSTVTIVSYANDGASSKINRDLSEQRALAVADYLQQQGVGDSSLSAKGRGRPVFLPASKTAQKNPYFRRIEIIVKGEEA